MISKQSSLKWDGTVTLGHLIQITVLVAALVAGWYRFDRREEMLLERQVITARTLDDIQHRTYKMEYYLRQEHADYEEKTRGVNPPPSPADLFGDPPSSRSSR